MSNGNSYNSRNNRRGILKNMKKKDSESNSDNNSQNSVQKLNNSKNNSNDKSKSKSDSKSYSKSNSKSESDNSKRLSSNSNESDKASYNDIESDNEKDIPKKTMEFMTKKMTETDNGISENEIRKNNIEINDDEDIGENYEDDFSENVSREVKYFYPKQTNAPNSSYFSEEKPRIMNRLSNFQ